MRGFALIAVLVALSILLALAAPFLLAMGHGDLAARHEVEEARVDLATLSVREFLLTQVTQDDTPLSDGLDEFPDRVELPPGLAALEENGRVQLGGEAWDLQRKIAINSATPLVYANLLGLAGRLAEDHEGEFDEVVIDRDASAFPDQGFLLLGREVIRYGRREGATFSELDRGLFVEEGFQPARFEGADGEPVKTEKGTLILDLRTVLAVCMPFWLEKTRYQPYAALRDLAQLDSLGRGGFDEVELQELERHCVVGARSEFGTSWGKPERVFSILEDDLERPVTLRVRSAADLGAGSIVRVRDVDGGNAEYAFVASTSAPGGDIGQVILPTNRFLNLLRPLQNPHRPTETVVERLVPVPVNANTASVDVLTAIMQDLRVRSRSITFHGTRENAAERPLISEVRAREIAETIARIRDPFAEEDVELEEGVEAGPFDGWESFERAVFKPMLDATTSRDQKRLLLLLYDAWQTGRPMNADMGTLPISFHSAPMTAYRAAANRINPLRGGESARLERRGTAVTLPGRTEFWTVDRQSMFEEMQRLDRRTPHWLSYPINVAAISPTDRGTDPALRTFSQTIAHAFPEIGLGQVRFPSDDPDDEKGMQPAPSSTPYSLVGDNYQHDSFSTALHPEGRDLNQEGYYEIDNSGPRSQANQGNTRPASHDRIRFPLTHDEGLPRRHGIQFWFRLDDTQEQALFEFSVPEEGTPDRNRISLQLRDGALVLEVLDELGLDPDSSVVDTAPERASGRWEVPLTEYDLRPNWWYHANFSTVGNRPGQVQLLIDGVPRGEPNCRTVLVQDIQPFSEPQNANLTPQQRRQQIHAQIHAPVVVESTEGFPQRGVLRIGTELIEYTSTDATTFYTDRVDSFGGRLSRQEIEEFVDSNGVPSGAELGVDRKLQVLGVRNTSWPQPIAPEHRAGCAVELYGYALPAYPNRFVEAGAMQLTSSIGAFAVARVANDSIANGGLAQIQLTGTANGGAPVNIDLGLGIDENWGGNSGDFLFLADPISQSLPAPPAQPEVLAAFNENGGYALLVQQHLPFDLNQAGVIGGSDPPVGGVEIIRYGSRSGSELRSIQRGLAIQVDGHTWEATDWFEPQLLRRFVTHWTIPAADQPQEIDLRPRAYTYIVPISLAVGGNVPDPSPVAEWVQLLPQNNEQDTEWVRYDAVLENRYLVRAEQSAFLRVLAALAEVPRNGSISVNDSVPLLDTATNPYPAPPPDEYVNSIGYTDAIEIQFPAIYHVRDALEFRGDPGTGTSSHAHNVSTRVLPCHRFELDWTGQGALAARAGRNDRIGLVQGSARSVGQVPGVEWHVVNWAVREYASDPESSATLRGGQNAATGRKDLGPYPFQLVGLKDLVSAAYLGAADRTRTLLDDTRLLDRAVKYPSGELPAADVQSARVGSSGHAEAPMRGVIDEVAAIVRDIEPRPLETGFDATAREFFVRRNTTMTASGPLNGVAPRHWPTTRLYPDTGGLLWVDGELIAYSDYDPGSGRFDVATDGRGLLGTAPQAHDSGALVHFVDQVPTEVLASPANERDWQLELERLGAFPRGGGTALVGRTELIHYTWVENPGVLAMPIWANPEEGFDEEGLYRGRYGTDPVSAPSGSPVIWFPFRYWHRYRDRADDPSLGYVQFTRETGPGWFDRFGWTEEGNSLIADLKCIARVDRRGSFRDDPERTPGLFLFEDGETQGGLNRIGMAGSRLELRFAVDYAQGAFDPQLFQAQDWKYAPILRDFVVVSESDPRILDERITAR